MASNPCWICGESLCSGLNGRVRSADEILGYSGMPISSFVTSLGFGSAARPKDASGGLSAHVCEACSILVFKLDVILFDKDRCLEQLRQRFNQSESNCFFSSPFSPFFPFHLNKWSMILI
jgi:hypothetical protein